MELGVKRGTVRIQEYSTNWVKAFEQEKALLLPVFGDNYLDIQHIGSTSIPNLIAKPLIDIGVKIKDIEQLHQIPDDLMALGYIERVGRLKGRQLVFAKGGDLNVTHHLHIIEQGEIDWEEKIRFRNILLANPLIAEEYGRLKKMLAAKYQENRSMYTKSKAQFIRKTLDA